MGNNLELQVQNLHITSELLTLIAEIDEFKGAWRAWKRMDPEELDALKQVAGIESTGSSTRIEGCRLSDKEVAETISRHSISNSDEQAVAGYAGVKDLIYQNYGAIPLSESYIRQLHAILLQYNEKDAGHRGRYKETPNPLEGFGPDGKSLGIVLETASPNETSLRMAGLIQWLNEAFAGKRLHPLLITSVFIVEFLAIHPFQDGNGRISRLLTTLLLMKQGYAYVPYSSLESVIEQSKEGYNLSLRQTQRTLMSDNPNWQPWVLFFIKALKRQKQRLEEKLEREKLLLGQLPDLSMKTLELIRSRGSATVRDIAVMTSANRNTIKKHLGSLVEKDYLQQNGVGKGTWYSAK